MAGFNAWNTWENKYLASLRRAAANLTSYVTYVMAQTHKLNKMRSNIENKHKLMFTLLVASVPTQWRKKKTSRKRQSRITNTQMRQITQSRRLADVQKKSFSGLQVFTKLHSITGIDITARDQEQIFFFKLRKQEKNPRLKLPHQWNAAK
jgi:hypothetical protein